MAGDQTIVFTRGGANIAAATAITTDGTATSISVGYDNLNAQTVKATITVKDKHDGDNIVYTLSTADFTTAQFKTPLAPSFDFNQNAVANDNKFTSEITNINANYGFTVDNITWQVMKGAQTSENLQDISGVYHPLTANPLVALTDVDGTNQTGIFGPATGDNKFEVNADYSIRVTKSFSQSNAAYPTTTGVPATSTVSADSVIHKYKGNPVITAVNIKANNTMDILVTKNQSNVTASSLTGLVMTNIGTNGTDPVTGNQVVVKGEVLDTAGDGNTTSSGGDNMIYTFTPAAGHTLNGTTFAYVTVSASDAHTASFSQNIPTIATGANSATE